MSKFVCVALIFCVGCRLTSDSSPDRLEPYQFAAQSIAGPQLSNEDAASLAATSLRSGETLAWSGPVFLTGLNQWFALAAAHRDDDNTYSRGYAVSYDHGEIDPNSLRRLELDSQRSLFGKLDPLLYQSISSMDADSLTDVVIVFHGSWVEYAPPEQPDVAIDGDMLRSYVSSHRAIQRDRIAESKQELFALLAELDLLKIRDYSGVPAVGATLPVWFLSSQQFNELASVAHVYRSSTDEQPVPLGYAGGGSMNEQLMNGGSCGTDCSGLGLIVGIWETTYDAGSGTHGTIANNNTRFSSVSFVHSKQPATCCFTDCNNQTGADDDAKCAASSQRCVNGLCRGEHVTDVAACVGMTGDYVYGGTGSPSDSTPNASSSVTFASTGAYAANFAIGNQAGGFEPEVTNFNWMIDDENSIFVNRSMTLFRDAHADLANWAARYDGVFLTIANGNELRHNEMDPLDQTGRSECEFLWNGLCVGWYAYNAYDDSSTHRRFIGNTSTHQGSTYLNPIANPLMERPHLLGPGGHQGPSSLSGLHLPKLKPNLTAMPAEPANRMTNALLLPGAQQILGSSFSSPAVLGTAILALQYEGFFSALSKPVVNKAVLLTAAVDSNADGAIGNSNKWAHSASTDYEDGVGHIDMLAVKGILNLNSYASLLLSDSDFVSCGTGCREYSLGSVTVAPKSTPRFTIAWNACTDGDHLPFVNNDFDLVVLPPATCNGGAALISDSGLTSEIETLRSPCAPLLTNTQWTIKIRIKNGVTMNSCYGDATERIGVAWR